MPEDSLFQVYVMQGGVMMIALIPCLFLAVAFAVQGALNLRRSRVAPKDFLARLRAEPEPRALLEREDHALAEILRNVLAHLDFKRDADPAEILRQEIESECDALLQQNSQLSIIKSVAPLLGLLGTVFGMIRTFRDFTESATPDVQQLSIGINLALITTAWGLSIAIPAYIVLYLLQSRVSRYEQVLLPAEGNAALHLLLDRRPARAPRARPEARTPGHSPAAQEP